MFTKILIANRGEIACRIIKTARRMGIACVAVYSDADKNALHVRMADEAVHIGAAPSAESYLKGDVIIKAAKDTGAQAIHPGYGFLSENAAFSKVCKKAEIAFIGPSEKSITAMGLKDGAKAIMDKAGVPIVPGYQGEKQDAAFLQKQADQIGYPVLIKAVAGGGGKGMRLVERKEDFKELLGNCQREGQASFGNPHVLIEKYITRPRHIEVQVFGDTHGNALHLFERDCSLQRRHQKVVEEAPAPGISAKMRKDMGEAAVRAAKAIDYHGAGTIEFIVDCNSNDFYFMEMNTRLQVEHPVTEMITGQDLVEWQIRIAAGEKLPLTQDEISIKGHAFEVRFYAEDPARNFMPQTGRVTHFSFPPQSEFLRVDTGIETGDSVTAHYDPMIAKLITHGHDRAEAARNMRTLLEQTILSGLNTNQEFLHNIFTHKDFLKADVDTGFIPRHEKTLLPESYGQPDSVDLMLIALQQFSGGNSDSDGATSSQDNTDTPDPWARGDNWRMNDGTSRRDLEFSVRGVSYALECEISEKMLRFTSDKKTVTGQLLSRAHHCIEALVDHVKHGAVIVAEQGNLTVMRNGRVIAAQLSRHDLSAEEGGQSSGTIITNMPGRIVTVLVKKGQKVEKDQPLLIMESMKVEMTIRAGIAGKIEALPVAVNDQVADGAVLVNIAPFENSA
jgi:3-methylcrotonyl-CoA carboxylase alpha subunit